MVKNTDGIFAESLHQIEKIFKEYIEEAMELDDRGEMTVNTLEKVAVQTMQLTTQVISKIHGSLLSNKVEDEIDTLCSCGRKMGKNKKDVPITILTMLGPITITRDTFFCRRCHKGRGVFDNELEINEKHRITKGMTEIITYMAQLVPAFDRAAGAIKKLLGIEVSATQLQIISEKIGERIFKKDLAQSKAAYERPEEAAPQVVPSKRKAGRLYILTDGSQVNTREGDNKGSTWKEMKLGLVFKDCDVIRRGDESHMITKKEYVSYFGSVNEFKMFLFAAATRAGYGTIKEVVVIGDGAAWIWNMVKEVFPDAVQILDYYHFSENTNNYAKFIFPEDEISRKRWVKSVLDNVLGGKVEKAITFIEGKKIDILPDNVVNLYNYVINNRERINYKFFKDNGYYIGSGAIESGNKTVIQQRMKQSGMRWSVDGGQYIAALRTKHESNMWDDVTKEIYAS